MLQTLNVLAQNANAKTSFIIMLAMENHEQGASTKANSIINQTKDKFLRVDYTLHVVREG